MENVTKNSSDLHDYIWSKEFSTFLAIVNIIVVACVVFGNIMVLLVIVRHRGMRTRTNLFLVNLAIADLFVGVFAMPFSITTLLEHKWVFGETVCLFNGWMNSFCLITSIHTLMYISIHKYFSIARPLSNPLTLRYIVLMMVAAWSWAAVCSTLNIVGLKVMYKPGTSQCGPNYPSDIPTYFIHVIIQITDLIIPFIILIFCYTRIFQEIRKLSKRLRAHSSAEDHDIIAQEKGVAVTMLIVLATFVIMALPYLAYANYTTIQRDKKHFSGYLNPVAYTFLYTSSMCNPIIYAFRSSAFREGYKEILCQKATYVTDEEANNPQRTNRLMSIISVLRRGSLPANQNIVNKNGDIVITRGDRIVCVRKANTACARGPANGVGIIPERLDEIREDNIEGNEDSETQGEGDVLQHLKANIERESLGDDSPHARGSSRYRRLDTDKNRKSRKDRPGSLNKYVESSQTGQSEKMLTFGGNSFGSENRKEPNLGADEDFLESKQFSDVNKSGSTKAAPAHAVADDSSKPESKSMSSTPASHLACQSIHKPSMKRHISRSSEELRKTPTFVRLPSMEFLDPPINIFRPTSYATSLEKIAKLKSKKPKSLSAEKLHHPCRPGRIVFDLASDIV